MEEKSLREVVSKNLQLTRGHIESFQDLITDGMRSKDRIRIIRSVNNNNIRNLADKWYAERIVFINDSKGHGCSYHAGQDYNYEIKMIREEIIKKYNKGEL